MNDAKKRNIQGTIVAFILGLLLGGLGTITMVARELMQAYKYDFDVECDDIIRYSITASVGSVIQTILLILTTPTVKTVGFLGQACSTLLP